MPASTSDLVSSRQNTKLPQKMRVIEVHPRAAHLRILKLQNRAAVVSRGLSRRRDIGQRTAMCSSGAPAGHDMAVARGKDLFDIEVEIAVTYSFRNCRAPS